MKKTWYIVGMVLGLVVMAIAQLPSSHARMVVCDVGQGDAILIIKGSNQVLIDGGPSSEKILSCLEQYVPFYDRTIELIVLTNTDFDHLNGLSAVVNRYEVIQFVTSDGVHESDALTKFRDTLTIHQLNAIPVEQGDVIKVGSDQAKPQLVLNVLWPPDTIEQNVAVFGDQLNEQNRSQILGASAKRGDLNDRSVVLLLLEGDKKILLTGDTGDQTEKLLLKQGILSDIDILKVGHHGSKYASGSKFLEALKPELAIISVGAKNRYGHPTQEVLERLSMVGSLIKRTDVDGSVVIDL
jgi:competence protein ComEC